MKDPFLEELDRLIAEDRDSQDPFGPVSSNPFQRVNYEELTAGLRPGRLRSASHGLKALVSGLFRKPLLLIIIIIAILGLHLAVSGNWTFRDEPGTWRGYQIVFKKMRR